MTDIRKLIDMDKHMLWSKRAEKAVKDDLSSRWPERVEELWEKTGLKYAEYLQDLPFMGGKKNRQASGVYDSILAFAYYEVLPEKLSKEELGHIVDGIFLPVYDRMEGKVNANRGLILRVMWLAFRMTEKQIKAHEEDWPGNYHMELKPYSKERGIEYRFTSCPIADFAKVHGLTDLMPCFCNPDYPMLEQMKAGLIREHTCSNGNYCDYWITGNESHLLDENPVYRDEDGYIRNHIGK